jgi:hypothetical protein
MEVQQKRQLYVLDTLVLSTLTLNLLPSLLKPIEPLEANRPTTYRQHET